MSKQRTNRVSTIGNNPFDTVIPVADELTEATELKPTLPKQRPANSNVVSQRKDRLTVHVPPQLAERVKNAAYWNPRLTIASIAEAGLRWYLDKIEREYGGPYPERESKNLIGGRPVK